MRNLASPGAWSVHIQEEKVSHIPSLGEQQLPAPIKQKAYLGKFGTEVGPPSPTQARTRVTALPAAEHGLHPHLTGRSDKNTQKLCNPAMLDQEAEGPLSKASGPVYPGNLGHGSA